MRFSNFHSLRLSTRLTLTLLVILVIGTWGLSYSLQLVLREDLDGLIKAQQLSTAATLAAEVNNELKARLNALEKVAASIDPKTLPHSQAVQSVLNQRPLLLGLFNNGAIVLNNQGEAIAEIPHGMGQVGTNFMARPYAVAALREGHSIIVPPFVSQLHATSLLVMAVPIRDPSGRIVGALAGSTDLQTPNFLDTLVVGGYGKTGSYRLVARAERLIVTSSDRSRILQSLPDPGTNPVIDYFTNGGEGVGQYLDRRGEEVLIAVKDIPIANWYLAVVLPVTEAFAPLIMMQKQVLRAILIIALLGGMLSFWLIARQLAPLRRTSQGISRMTANLNSPLSPLPLSPLPVASNDEIGQLVISFNGLTAALMKREEDLLMQKRRAEALLELPRLISRSDEKSFMQKGLEFAEDLTGSEISFIHFVNPDEETIELVTWSYRTLERYCHASFASHYPVPQAGIWADALRKRRPVIFNDYPACPHKRGLPEGHAALSRLISVPVFEKDRVVMLAGVGNKASDYSQFDVNTVQLISNEIWNLVQRHRSITESQQLNDLLEERVQARTAALENANRELSEAKAAAESANRAKTTFLANMSHELRTPLSAVIGLTELAMMRITDAKPLEQLGKVIKASDHLLELINKVLDLSKIESERLVLNQTEFCIDEIVASLGELYRQQAQQKGLKLIIVPAPELAGLRLLGDPTRLKQILFNLVSNAIKFTEQGEVQVAIGYQSAPSNVGFANLCFEITDTGIGIQDEDLLRIFSAFEQASTLPMRQFGGSGLGLTISRRLARLMGGDIDVASTFGKGSRFRLTVRLGRADNVEENLANRSESFSADRLRSQFAGARILVVEDDESTQEVVLQCLENVGMQCTLAADGAEAIEAARVTNFDLILMDVLMPKLSGIDATRIIRGDSRNCATPILALTANAFTDDQERCIHAGMDGHVGKPFKIEYLYDQILRWLARKSGISSNT